MIELNKFRKNIYMNYGWRECPHYGEDGVIQKIFNTIGAAAKPFCIEFGESRVLGTTTRSYRIEYKASAIYFTGDYSLKSFMLNLIDVVKAIFVTKNIEFARFYLNMPFKYYVTPENIIGLFTTKVKNKEIDILTIDIDSYDYYLIRKILGHGYRPKLMILEYNPSLGVELKLTHPIRIDKPLPNRRLYGASYAALDALSKQYGYKLCFVSGFCNLFYIRSDYGHMFQEVDIKDEITDTDEKILDYINKHCQKGFIPSWFSSPRLREDDLLLLDQLD